MSEKGEIKTGLKERKNTFSPSFFVLVSVALKPFLSASTSGHYYNANQAAEGSSLIVTNVIFHTPPQPLKKHW
jgi:hypothetical protein